MLEFWDGRALKSPRGSKALGGGDLKSNLVPGVTPPTDDITLCRVELQELACVREIKVKGKEIKRHNSPWLSVTSVAFHSN